MKINGVSRGDERLGTTKIFSSKAIVGYNYNKG